jgi:hypothetical protein
LKELEMKMIENVLKGKRKWKRNIPKPLMYSKSSTKHEIYRPNIYLKNPIDFKWTT